MKPKYTLIELFFSHWRWVRVISGSFWVRENKPGHRWTKWSDKEMRGLGWLGTPSEMFPAPEYQYEDWRTK